MQESIQKKFITISQADKFYQFKSDAGITFDNFYKPIMADEKHFQYIPAQSIQFDQFLGVEIGEQIHFKLYQKSSSKSTWQQTKQLLKNPLGFGFFKKIYQQIKKQSQKPYSLASVIQKSFQEQITKSPDLLVSDIYGPDSSIIGLPANLLASSLGKISKQGLQNFQKQSIVRSLLTSLAINCAQIARLLSRKEKTTNIMVLKNDFESKSFNRIFYTLFMMFYGNIEKAGPKLYFKEI